MSPAGSTTFTVGETVSQNLFKTASGDIATITGRVISSNSTTLVIDQIRPDHTAMKQLISEGGRGGVYGLFMETGGAWKTAQSNTDITVVHGIVGASSGAKAIVNSVADASVKTDQGSGQAFIVGEDIVESDVGLYDRIIRANVTAHGHEVVKEVEILPHYAHTKIYFDSLVSSDRILPGEVIRGNTSGKLGVVTEEGFSTLDSATQDLFKFIIVTTNDSLGANTGSFLPEIILANDDGRTLFNATKIEEHHPLQPNVQGGQSPIIRFAELSHNEQDMKFAYDHMNKLGVNRILYAQDTDPNAALHLASEFYGSTGTTTGTGETRQRRKNITILQTFASANTKSGRTLTVVPDSKEDLNQQGLRGSANATTIAYVGGLDWGETIKSATSDSIINNLSTGNSNHLVPSDAKRINSVANVDEEFIITEDGYYLTEENDHGFLMAEPEPEKYNSYTTTDGKYYVGDLWSVDPTEELTLEDGSRLALEDATDIEKNERFVTERSFNLGSYFMKSEVQDTMVYEDGSRIIQENAVSFGEPVERIGPTLGDLAKIGFSQTLIKEENIIQEDGDDILIENEGGKLLIEAPYEGVKISDISTLYPKESVSDLQEHVGRSMILSHPASIHIDNGTALGM